MNKSDLVDHVAATTNEAKSKVGTLVDALLNSVAAALQKGDKVTLPGFGTFLTRKRQARSGRNPRTGAAVKIAATTVPVFKAGATLKSSVAGKKAASAKASAKPKAAAKRAAKPAAKAAAKAVAKPAAKVAAKAKSAAKPAAKTSAKAVAKPAAKASAAKKGTAKKA
jgi:DNA-binding protein HU-beta